MIKETHKPNRRQYRASHRKIRTDRPLVERRRADCGCMITVRLGYSFENRVGFHYRQSAGCKRRAEREVVI